MIAEVKVQTVSSLMRVRVMQEDEVARLEEERRRKKEEEAARLQQTGPVDEGDPAGMTVRRNGEKVGRNAPCPCGSGKKYKHCHGRAA